MKKKYVFFVLMLLFIFFGKEKAFAEEWIDPARESIDLPSAIQAGLTGEGVKIAILDSGIEKSHDAFKGAHIAEGVSCVKSKLIKETNEFECVEDSEYPWDEDTDGHGTGVAGTIVSQREQYDGVAVGVAPEAIIYSVRVKENDHNPSTDEEQIYNLAAGIYWAIDHKVDIINISQYAGDWIQTETAVEKARKKGILVIAGVGNDGNNDPNEDTMSPLAEKPGVIAVGGYNDSETRCAFEIIPRFCGASTGPFIDVAAPYSFEVLKEGNGHTPGHGTSYGSPMVAGVAALIKEQFPSYKAPQLSKLLIENAKYLEGFTDGVGTNWEFGSGKVQATPFRKAQNPFFNTWIEEMNRKSSHPDVKQDNLVEGKRPGEDDATYTNYAQGYTIEIPPYWFIDHVEPSKYVRLFMQDFKLDITFDKIESEEEREQFIEKTISTLPPGTEMPPIEDKHYNDVRKYAFQGQYIENNNLNKNIYYFVNGSYGVFTIKLVTTKDNLEEPKVYNLEKEVEKIIKSLDYYTEGQDFTPTGEEINDAYNTRVADPSFFIPTGKTMFGLYDSEWYDQLHYNIPEWENELNNPPMGTQTVKGYLSYYGRNDGELPYIQQIIDAGKTPIIDLELGRNHVGFDLVLLNEGSFDERIKDWANELKSLNKPVFVRLGSGMNGSMKNFNASKYPNSDYDFEYDSDLYKAAYRHVVDLMKKEDADNIKFVWSPNVQSYPNVSFNDMSLYYPGDDYVDWINMMGYNIDGEGEIVPHTRNVVVNAKTQTFNDVFDQTYKELRRMYPHKPMMIETSSLNLDNSKEAYIHSMFDHLTDYPNIQLVTWYNGSNDYWIYDYGKTEFNITLPRTTNEYVGNMLKDESKFVSQPN
mgnify:CR=1 FL=1